MSKPNFTFDDFRKWIQDQNDFESIGKPEKQNSHIGTPVESKAGVKRLVANMEPEVGELHELALDFKRDGGTIVGVDGKMFMIEVDSGQFMIPRHYVRKA